MNAILYYSCSGQSKLVAEDLARRLDYNLYDINCVHGKAEFNKAVIIFPVHCQGVPIPLKPILKNITAKYTALIATYGRANPGNALYEASLLIKNIVAAAYIPAKHTYNIDEIFSATLPEEIIERILNPKYIVIPKRRKTPFAGILPSFRSRLLLKIIRNSDCNRCNICTEICPVKAIINGHTNLKCTRCLKCVYACPKQALTIHKSLILKKYLIKPHTTVTLIYL